MRKNKNQDKQLDIAGSNLMKAEANYIKVMKQAKKITDSAEKKYNLAIEKFKKAQMKHLNTWSDK